MCRSAARAKAFSEFFDDSDGPMTAAGATDSDGHVFLSFLHEARQEQSEHGFDLTEISGEVWIRLNIGRNGGV